MPKKWGFIILFVTVMSFFAPIKADALDSSFYKESLVNNIYLLEKDEGITSTDELDDLMDDYDQEQDCEGSNSILGDPNDENSVAWLLQQVLNYIKIIGPLLVVVLSSIDFVQVIVKSDDDAMKKAQKKLIYRLILAASLFFIPLLVQVMLDLFGITANPTCGLK